MQSFSLLSGRSQLFETSEQPLSVLHCLLLLMFHHVLFRTDDERDINLQRMNSRHGRVIEVSCFTSETTHFALFLL